MPAVVDWSRFTPSDFEYDYEADHLSSHSVTLEEAAECFYNAHAIRRNKRFPDRWQLVGRSDSGRRLIIIFQLKTESVVRIITGWPS